VQRSKGESENRGIGESERRRRGAEQSLAVVTDRRGECDDPAAASGLLHTLRAGHLEAPMLAPAEPRWGQLRFAATPGPDLRDRFRGALVGGTMVWRKIVSNSRRLSAGP
jgi:hypothetical protein